MSAWGTILLFAVALVPTAVVLYVAFLQWRQLQRERSANARRLAEFRSLLQQARDDTERTT